MSPGQGRTHARGGPHTQAWCHGSEHASRTRETHESSPDGCLKPLKHLPASSSPVRSHSLVPSSGNHSPQSWNCGRVKLVARLRPSRAWVTRHPHEFAQSGHRPRKHGPEGVSTVFPNTPWSPLLLLSENVCFKKRLVLTKMGGKGTLRGKKKPEAIRTFRIPFLDLERVALHRGKSHRYGGFKHTSLLRLGPHAHTHSPTRARHTPTVPRPPCGQRRGRAQRTQPLSSSGRTDRRTHAHARKRSQDFRWVMRTTKEHKAGCV